MTAEEFADEMEFLLEEYGEEPEACLGKMADLMAMVLRRLDYGDGVECYRELVEGF